MTSSKTSILVGVGISLVFWFSTLVSASPPAPAKTFQTCFCESHYTTLAQCTACSTAFGEFTKEDAPCTDEPECGVILNAECKAHGSVAFFGTGCNPGGQLEPRAVCNQFDIKGYRCNNTGGGSASVTLDCDGCTP
jgi:hypothetical protein